MRWSRIVEAPTCSELREARATEHALRKGVSSEPRLANNLELTRDGVIHNCFDT